ncbi:MAG: DUF2326 domain-containing protein [Homoserinimonas sp.]
MKQLYGKDAALTVAVDDSGYKFTLRATGSGNSGVDRMTLFCFDLTKLEEGISTAHHPDFLVHDSSVFDGVVAREAADIVLLDDNFATIESALDEGRRIVANIRHFGQLLFSWHRGVVIVVAVSFISGFTTPLAGLMIPWNNLVIDVIPSFAPAMEPGKKDAMKDPPWKERTVPAPLAKGLPNPPRC